MKFEIKSWINGSVLFSIETDSWKLAVEAAVKSGANLGGAYLRGANLGGANLDGADLGGAYLRGADLGGAYLRGANLDGAYLRGANLGGANLRGAYLRGANLGGAYLGGANLDGADLGGAYLRGATIHKNITITRAPLQLLGLYYPVTIWDEHMQIGCEFHSLAEWREFPDERILEMDSRQALNFWRAHKAALMAIAESDKRGVGQVEEVNVTSN